MTFKKSTLTCAILLSMGWTSLPMAQTHHGVEQKKLTQARVPHERSNLPPSLAQAKYNLSPSTRPRTDLGMASANLATTPACQDMIKLASYSGAALADYIVNLPDYECHYGLFSLDAVQAAKVYSPANFAAVANRFVQEAGSYHADNIKLINLLIYLRAGYYLASGSTIPEPAASLTTTLRTPIKQLVEGNVLYQDNSAGSSTAAETLRLITNMKDEVFYLPSMKAVVQRFTNGTSQPQASAPLLQRSASGGFTGVLTVIYYAHYRSGSNFASDMSFATLLNNFVVNNKSALLGTSASYQLNDAENEAFRFMQYPNLLPGIKPMVQSILASSSMTGPDSDLWLAAASSVTYYDNSHCADYGTCNYETRLADAVLKNSYTCSPGIRIRAQDMTPAQMQQSCDLLANEENYFHTMLKTQRKPLPGDNNTALELVVFDDYTNYSKYAGAIYGISTDNGGMYLEGNPATPGNQARFIAHEASWLRPTFSVWNLEHEYIHYLDGRFDMQGDFNASTVKPTVWWIEGIAEYLSLRNKNQKAIDATAAGTYSLSTIFGNTYAMSDYVNRAYRWGYMATRFMNERHRSDIDKAVSFFRVGDYSGYQNYMNSIGVRYDAEFLSWLKTASTAGDPPLPSTTPTLPACTNGNNQLGKNCMINNLASSGQAYAYILLPVGAKNLKLFTTGGTGDVNMYVAKDRYPGTTSYDFSSSNIGNEESVNIATPVSGHWYYITLNAKQPFSGLSLGATYE